MKTHMCWRLIELRMGMDVVNLDTLEFSQAAMGALRMMAAADSLVLVLARVQQGGGVSGVAVAVVCVVD